MELLIGSVETQHTIGYGGRQTTEECPEAIAVMSFQVISFILSTAAGNPDIMSWSMSIVCGAHPTSQNFESQQWMTLSMRNSVQTIELLHHWPLNSSEICCFQAWLAKMESSAECFLELKWCWEKENTTWNKKKIKEVGNFSWVYLMLRKTNRKQNKVVGNVWLESGWGKENRRLPMV